jgi:hypothetical protein
MDAGCKHNERAVMTAKKRWYSTIKFGILANYEFLHRALDLAKFYENRTFLQAPYKAGNS